MRKLVMFLGLILSPLFMSAQDFMGRNMEFTYVECTAKDQQGTKFIIESAFSDAMTIEEWFDLEGNSIFKYAFLFTPTHPDDFSKETLKVLNKYGVTSYYRTNSGDGVAICQANYRLINIASVSEGVFQFTIIDLVKNEQFKVIMYLGDCKGLDNNVESGEL
jgi:hypothetical protein